MTEPATHTHDGHEHTHDGHHHDHHHHDDHDHDHPHEHGWLGTIASTLHIPGFSHDHGTLEAGIRDNAVAIHTVQLAFLILGGTTLLQVLVYLASGSVALLGDTVHNLGDALNSIPLLIAFMLAR